VQITQFVFFVPNTTIRIIAEYNFKWRILVYYAGEKDKATVVKDNLNIKELIKCLKILVTPNIFKNSKKLSKKLLIHILTS
jgi:hypothetical protein